MQTEPHSADAQYVKREQTSAEPEAPSATIAAGPRARIQFKNYYRWLKLSRLVLLAFLAMSGVAMIWLVPWFPRGLDADDYTPEMAFTVYILGSATVLGVVALFLQERARRDRESLLVWSSVYDEATGLRNRSYLYDRIALECERSQRSSEPFSVIALQIRSGTERQRKDRKAASLPTTALREISRVINDLTHPTDMVAYLGSSELAVLAVRVNREARHALQERLRDAVAKALPQILSTGPLVDVKAGAATYGADGTDPSALVMAARTAASLARPQRAKAA
jgi:diguanylate cyclase (GGDEF)-like protein